MTTLAVRPTQTPSVTADQMELITRTVAQDATTDELRLYLYDCARQGVHPLDRLIHFTKRGGRYTPITSIDFMRQRAAETGEYAGSDDAVFSTEPGDTHFAATVSVYRIVQGQRCSFTATARWAEYCPPAGQDHMWRRMPHTMLAKCSEALALRKGFPRQLAGLYAKEELDQAEAVAVPPAVVPVLPKTPPPALAGAATARQVQGVRVFGKDKNNYAITFVGDELEYTTKNEKHAAELESYIGTDHRVLYTSEDRPWNNKIFHNLKAFTVVPDAITAADIPF
jgi:phage recombination protein Bet